MSATHAGPVPAFTGGPAGVKAPLVEWTAKGVRLSEPRFATYANRPEGSRVSATGFVPADTVEAGIRAPLAASMAKTDTLPAVVLATYANRPYESTTTEDGPSALVTRGVSGVKAPVAVSMEKVAISFEPKFATEANFPEGCMAIEVGLVGAGTAPRRPSAPELSAA